MRYMTPKEALEFIDRVLAEKVVGNRYDHININNAMTILRDEIDPKEKPYDTKARKEI